MHPDTDITPIELRVDAIVKNGKTVAVVFDGGDTEKKMLDMGLAYIDGDNLTRPLAGVSVEKRLADGLESCICGGNFEYAYPEPENWDPPHIMCELCRSYPLHPNKQEIYWALMIAGSYYPRRAEEWGADYLKIELDTAATARAGGSYRWYGHSHSYGKDFVGMAFESKREAAMWCVGSER